MPTSDEQLQQKVEEVRALRESLASEEAKRLEREAGVSNDIALAQLNAEAAQLKVQLAAAKASNSAAAVKAGADAPLQAAKDDLAAANASQKAQDAAQTAAAKRSES